MGTLIVISLLLSSSTNKGEIAAVGASKNRMRLHSKSHIRAHHRAE